VKRTSVWLYMVVVLSLSSIFTQQQETAASAAGVRTQEGVGQKKAATAQRERAFFIQPPMSMASMEARDVQMRRMETRGQLPLSFEPNQGQTDNRVKFLSRGKGYVLFLAANEAVLELAKGSRQPPQASRYPGVSSASNKPLQDDAARTAVLRMRLAGANPSPETVGLEELPGKSNYFIGKDPSKWHTNVPMYSRVKYHDVYPGIDLVYYGNQRQLEQDFVIRPGAEPRSIVLGFQGADKLEVDAEGELVLHTAIGPIRQQRPFIYQEVNGVRREISGGYVLKSKDRVGFDVAAYNTSRPLVIDPVLLYSTYLGGGGELNAAITVDSAGNAYVTGVTTSTNYPTTAGDFQTTAPGGPGDAFVTKLNPTGSGLVYSTYLGGSGSDQGSGIAVDSSGNAYVTGVTFSRNFPTTLGAFQTTGPRGNQAAFVTKLNPTGSGLLYSTYLGGSYADNGASIAVDSSGNAYVTGQADSNDFPTTAGAFQPTFGGGNSDAYVAKLNPTGSGLVYSTYLGGINQDQAIGIAVDSSGDAYVVGTTGSADFPTTAGAFQATGNQGAINPFDAFVTKVNPTGSGLVYSTYLGGSRFDEGTAIAVNALGNAYVTGLTESADFPTTVGALQTTLDGTDDAFVTKLDPTGSVLVYSTYLGGSSVDFGRAIAVDSSGNAYVAGLTESTNFPTSAGAFQPTSGGSQDAFVTEVNPTGSGLVYSSYLGGSGNDYGQGIALDSLTIPNAYVTGTTSSTDFPTTPGAFQTTFGGGTSDAFVVKIAPPFSFAPLAFPTQAMEGDLKLNPGDTLRVGYDFTMPGSHPSATVRFSTGQVSFPYTCVSGPGAGNLIVPFGAETYPDTQNSSAWVPSGNQQDPSVFQGQMAVPDLCSGNQVRFQKGGTFTTGVCSTDSTDKVNARWHYSGNGSAGGWSGTKSVVPAFCP